MEIFNGIEFSKKILHDLKIQIASLDFAPEFSDILVGQDGPSVRYVNMKKRIAGDIGIEFIDSNLAEDTTTNEIISKIHELSLRPNMCGIIVQLPLPENIDTKAVLDSIPVHLDVDGLSTKYDEVFYENNNSKDILIMPTASAVIKILNSIEKNLENKKIVVIGHGKLVGKPIVHLLKQTNAIINIIDRKTDDARKKEILNTADVVITAVGSPNILQGEDVRDGVVVIDAGTLEVSGVLVGDADFTSLQDKCSFITPTPGGVGPVTVACLMQNVFLVAKNKK